MADLKKWFPFKFKRNKAEAEASQVPAKVAPAAQSVPSLLMPAFPEMSRMMERMFSEPFFSRLPSMPFSALGELDRFFGDYSPAAFSPSVDVVDEGTHVEVSAELPGLDKGDIDLSVHEGALVLRGHKKHEESKQEEGCYRTERYFGSFLRTIPLPVDVELDKAEAKFERGVLTVRLPKTERAEQPKKITVS